MKRDFWLPDFAGAGPGGVPPGADAILPACRVPIEAMPDAVLVVAGAGHRVVGANQAACRLLLGSPVELCGRAIMGFLPTPEDHAYWSEAAAGVSDLIDSESHVATLAGAFVPVMRRVSPIVADDGSRLHIVMLRDRSAEVQVERRLEAAVADLRATLESTCDGLLVVDRAGGIRHMNRRFAAVWRMPAELLMRRDDDAVFEWMRRSVDDSASYMRRLAQIDVLALPEARDLLHLRNGTTIERVATLQRTHDRPTGQVFAFREVAGAIESGDMAPPIARETLRIEHVSCTGS